MDDYNYEQRRKKRGDNCIFSSTDKNGVSHSHLCGCGSRMPPNKKHKTRIVKRTLKRKLSKILEENT